MSKCLDLSRLPKAPGLRSIKRNIPGSPLPLIFPGSAPYSPSLTIDPNHPATRWKTYAFPQFSCPAFTLRAVPNAALVRPELDRRSCRVERSAMVSRGKDGSKRLNMSILFMISKQKTNKRAVVRNRIAMRIRTALELIVSRGADAERKVNVKGRQVSKECRPEEPSGVVRKRKIDCPGRESKLGRLASPITRSNLGLVSNPAPSRHLILQDWTYVMSPTLLSYRMPLPDLIRHLRAGLERILAQSKDLNEQWGLNRKPTIKLPLSNITRETEVDWRHAAIDADDIDIPLLFDLDQPGRDLIKAGAPINSQKRPFKLFFPTSTSPSSGESLSALIGDDQLVTSPRSVDTPTQLASPADHRSSSSVSDHSNTTPPAVSNFRLCAMERLAKNRPLVAPGRKVGRSHS